MTEEDRKKAIEFLSRQEATMNVMSEIERIFALMKASKPNDKSEQDRCWAIAITDMQKLVAFFKMWVV